LCSLLHSKLGFTHVLGLCFALSLSFFALRCSLFLFFLLFLLFLLRLLPFIFLSFWRGGLFGGWLLRSWLLCSWLLCGWLLRSWLLRSWLRFWLGGYNWFFSSRGDRGCCSEFRRRGEIK